MTGVWASFLYSAVLAWPVCRAWQACQTGCTCAVVGSMKEAPAYRGYTLTRFILGG